jgi:hypothetical protein
MNNKNKKSQKYFQCSSDAKEVTEYSLSYHNLSKPQNPLKTK